MRTHPWSFAALVAAIVLSGPLTARAQAVPTSPSPPTQSAPSRAGSLPISEEAKRHFNAGVNLLQDPEGERVEEAYREFKSAYDISGSPKVLGNMGLCAMRLERDGEAIDAYSRYLREVTDIDADERAQIVRDLQTLTVGVVRVTLTVNVPGAIVLDERVPVRGAHVTNTYGPVNDKIEVGIRPGHHVITARLAGYEDATWVVEAYTGGKDQHAFTMKERIVASPGPEREASPSLAGPILVLSTGALMLGAGAVTGVIALNKTNDIADRCPNDVCPRSFDLDSERSRARTFVGVTDVLLIIGGVTALGGLYWLFRAASSEPKPTAKGQVHTSGLLGDWRLAL
jgi:hypothetical protein